MKKNWKRMLALSAAAVLSIGTVGTMAGCGGKGGSGGIEIDPHRSQLYVYNFAGGFGTEWLTKLAEEYERLNAETVYEEGVLVDGEQKKGIQIVPSNIKNSVTGTTVSNGKEMIYFTEHVDLYGDLIANSAIADITEALTEANPYDTDGTSLLDRLYEDQKAYLGRKMQDGSTKYYAYPHYLTTFGLTYDIDLFDSMGFYFAETPITEVDGEPITDETFLLMGKFVNAEAGNTAKSAGPDGVGDTKDDGLPATYEEFFELCEYITLKGCMPINWTGKYYDGYIRHLYNALVTEYEGYAQMRLNFTFKGEATDLGTINSAGEFVLDTEATQITGSNGYELKRQAGKYYALEFIEKLFALEYVSANETYLFGGNYTHFDAQDDFLNSKYQDEKIAMLAEGSWWEAEATGTFNRMAGTNAQDSKMGRNLGWMPLPKANESKVGEKPVLYDIMYPMTFVKAGVSDWRYDAAVDFIQFLNSQQGLQMFNEITSVPKAVKYEITDFSNMSNYGKSLYEAKQSSDIVFPYAQNVLFMNNQGSFSELSDGGPCYFSSVNPGYSPNKTIRDKGVSAEAYFTGMYTYAQSLKIWTDV